MDRNSGEKESATVRELIDLGSEMAGSASGAAIGLFLGGPVGSVVGASIGAPIAQAFRKAGGDVARRWLSPREQIRIGAAMAAAASRVSERLEKGDTIRADGFFDVGSDGERSEGEEVVEHTLKVARNQVEERKLPYVANFLANIAFTDKFTGADAHHLLQIAEDLTFRQLCLIHIFARRSRFELRESNYSGVRIGPPVSTTLFEAFDLYRKGLIWKIDGEALLDVLSIVPAQMKPEGLGASLFFLMQLDDLTRSDVDDVAATLSPTAV